MEKDEVARLTYHLATQLSLQPTDAGKRRDRKGTKLSLSSEQEQQLADAFSPQRDADEVLVTKFNISIHRRDIRLLQPAEWLNDEIINFYMKLLQEYCDRRYALHSASRSASEEKEPGEVAVQATAGSDEEKREKDAEAKAEESSGVGTKTQSGEEDSPVEEELARRRPPLRCHFFNTFFCPLLTMGGYDRVARWTRHTDLLSMDLIIFPIHKNVHWTLATASPQERLLAYYDSMHSMHQDNPYCLHHLENYLVKEEEKKSNKKDEPRKGWRFASPKSRDVPVQMNGYDCGVFTCMFARFCALGRPVLEIHQSDMPYYRKLIALEILNGTIIN